MKINQRLRLNAWISLGAIVLMMFILALSFREVYRAERNILLADQMRRVAFERIFLRDDYLLNPGERAKVQWYAKSENLRALLESASERFTNTQDKALLREARNNFDEAFSSFSAILGKHKQNGHTDRNKPASGNAESVLISQVFLNAYVLNDNIDRLHESSSRAMKKAQNRGVIFIFLFVACSVIAIAINSIFISRVVTKNLKTLHEGVKIIGTGNLDYHIDMAGDNELSDLARESNKMVAKLKASYTSVENLQQEITERKQAEDAMKLSEQKYRSIFENAVEGIFQTSPEGQYISVNPAVARIIGYDAPEELIKVVTDLSKQGYVNPEDRIRYKKILEEQGTIKEFETQHYKKDGGIIWVSINARTVKGEAGKLLYYEGTIEDITGRKLAEESLQQTTEKLRKSLSGTIQAMSLIVETRDPYTAGHQRKVSSLACAVAQEMGLSSDTVDTIRMAGTIHDIGKISVPAEILSKPGILTNKEMSLIKVHSQTGYDILKDVGLPYPMVEIILQHHERLDGSGYPKGLKDGQIFLESQIISVADVVEAIASHRPYRPARGIDAALEEIEKNAGVLYYREVVEACLKLFREKGFKFE